MAHGQWTEVEARGVLEACRRSGLSMERFAKERGLVPQRLRSWKKKIAERDARNAVATAPAVLPVRVASERAPRGEPVTVLLRTGHMLKVSHGFDEDAFARVVALLEGS
jgi:hypothetical protein